MNNFKEASNIVNYDSIINCCLKKYKTAGGFVWRFKGDDFNITSQPSSNEIKCKICNSIETPRSMAMHLKWAHTVSTSDYINQYGEFRPKMLNNIEKSQISNIVCHLCNIKLNSNQHLMYHLTTSHPETTKSEYIIENLLNGDVPLCKCGCGNPVTLLENGKNCDLGKDTYHRDYIKGHWDWEVFTGIGKQSKEEIELVNYIKSICSFPLETNVRKIIPKFEIDIYIPELMIGIEYNGLYWHSEKCGKSSDYHIHKMKEANKQGIRLIQIFSDEWINKKDIVKSKLISILQQTKTTRIFARKCYIFEIDAHTKNNFLNLHHIQGEDRSSVKLGLFNGDELISVMTFSSPRISLGQKHKPEGIYELSRFASSQYVVGGSSKLINYFIKKYTPKEIYSYSDNRWTDPDNNMYLKLNFKKTSTSSPGYFYTKNYLSRFHRYNFNKGILKKMGADINKTEKEIMESLGYTRIWDCGTTKYILKIY